MGLSRDFGSRDGSRNGDNKNESAEQRDAQLQLVRDSMMEELGIGRVESLRKFAS